MPAQSWLYTCAVPVSGQCANAHLPSIGGDLVPENTAFILVPIRGTDTCHSDPRESLEVFEGFPKGNQLLSRTVVAASL